MIKKLIPDYYFKSIYDIPFDKLYENGIRLILTDLDNTLISYDEELPNEKLFLFKDKLTEMGFEFILVSNSRKNRVDKFAKNYNIDYVKFSMKPLKRGIRKAIKKIAKNKYNKNQIILLGDQLMTDVLGAKRYGIEVALIEAIDKKTDIGPTRINRRLEGFFLKRIKRRYPSLYNERLKEYDIKKM